jgi:putative nucleotidyltransferase-like protein
VTLSANESLAVRSLAADMATAQLARELTALDVRWLLLKGPSIARRLYADGAHRPYVDVDALVSPDDFATVEEALRRLGFSPAPYSSRPAVEHDAPWRRQDGCVVDLHRGFTHVPAGPEAIWAAFTRDARPLTVAGAVVESPGDAALALIVALHALGDAPSEGKAMADLVRAARQLSIETWSAARSLAAELGAERNLAAALSLTPEAAGVARDLRLPALSRWEIKLRTGGRAASASVVHSIVTAPGVRSKVAALLRELRASAPNANGAGEGTGRLRARAARLRRGIVHLPVTLMAWWVQRHDFRTNGPRRPQR